MDAVLNSIEALPLAFWMRAGAWPFPAANTVHVIGIALLFGGIAAFDLRLLHAGGRAIEISALARLILPLAMTGFALAVASGALMFIANAREYWANPLFSWKLGLIAAAGLNALVLHATSWRHRESWGERAPVFARAAGFASLALWAGVIGCGRLMAYF
jgi:hypothetical protein